MKRGFLLPIIFLLFLAGIGIFIFSKFSRTPTQTTQETAKGIPEYPEAKNWTLKARKNICFFATDDCSQPIDITFNSTDDWQYIYYFYKEALPKEGWTTNSEIWTSIPTNPIYTEDTKNCTVSIKEAERNLYMLTVICPDR